jgi:integrase
MARSHRAPTENRTTRLKLPIRKQPYYSPIAPGVKLGYRRNRGAGSWSVKVADGHGAYWLKSIGVADDFLDANGAAILNFWQASDRARKIASGDKRDATPAGDRPLTVSEALRDYAAALRSRKGDTRNVSRVAYHLPPTLAAKFVGLLSARDLRAWRDAMLKSGKNPTGLTDASANRTCRALKAALNLAATEDPRITNRSAWKDGLKGLSDAEVARSNAILSDEQVRALVAKAYALDPGFGLWVEVHAVTGARTSQLLKLEVGDLQDAGPAPRLMMPSSQKGRKRRIERKPVAIPPSLAQALRLAAAERVSTEPLVKPPGGETLLRNWLARTVKAAGLPPSTTLYSLRHSSIVRSLLAGVPIRIVAVAHDTSTVMIERNYSNEISDHADAVMRKGLLDLGAPAGGNVIPLVR